MWIAFPLGACFPEWPTNYPAISFKETLRSMASPVPPRDWTDIHWPDIERSEAARWIAVLPLAATEQHGPHLPLETDVLIGEAYLARVRELLPADAPVTFLPLQPVGVSTEHIDFPGTQTLPVDVALKEWTAIGESVARSGVRKLVMVTSHGGNSAAMSLVAQELRAHHRLLVVTTNWSRFGAPDGLFSDGGIAPRHPWRRRRDFDHAGAISAQRAERGDRRFSPREHRHGEEISLALGASARALCVADAGFARKRRGRRRHQGFRGEGRTSCSITARARSANCSTMSTNSIRNCFFAA